MRPPQIVVAEALRPGWAHGRHFLARKILDALRTEGYILYHTMTPEEERLDDEWYRDAETPYTAADP